MRLRRLPKNFHFIARSSLPELPESARSKIAVVMVVNELRKCFTATQACAVAGVPRATYYRWRARLQQGPSALSDGRANNERRRRAPIRERHRQAIEAEREALHLGKAKLAVTLAAKGIHVSASTVQRVLSAAFQRGSLQRLGYSNRSSSRRRNAARRAHAQRKRSNLKPLRAGELVQVDTLHETSVVGRPRYQFTAVDPTERHYYAQLYSRPTSRNAAHFLQELITAFPVPIKSIQVDNGSEYKGEFEAACQRLNIKLYTIPPATPKANGMVERAQRSSREEHYAYEPPCLTLADERQALAAYVHHYNHTRPHQALNYLTPMQYHHARNLRTSQLG